MKRVITTIAFTLAVLFATAAVYTPTSIPMVHLEDRNRYVCDPEGILSPEARSTVDAIFREIEDSTGVQTVIAVVPEIEPNDCFQFAYDLLEKNGVGQEGKDNGLSILLCTSERCIQFVTGYGLEGILPDAICRRIQETHMNGYFAQDNWDAGMVSGAEALKDRLLNGELTYENDWGEKGESYLWLILLVFGTPLALLFGVTRREKRCPECGQYKMKVVDKETLYRSANGRKIRITMRCENCGHEKVKDVYISNGNNTSGGSMGGGWGGGFGGGIGGSFGGSFGGGHSGGGGAGSHF